MAYGVLGEISALEDISVSRPHVGCDTGGIQYTESKSGRGPGLKSEQT